MSVDHTLEKASTHHLGARTRYLWIEVGVVVLVWVVPFIFNSEADIYGLRGRTTPVPFTYRALQSLINSISEIALVLFILWRSGDIPARFGLKPFRLGRDLIGGLIILVILRGMHHFYWWILHSYLTPDHYMLMTHTGTGMANRSPSGSRDFALLITMCLASGYVQELVMRAYLITRFEELLESTGLAILLSTVLFVFYHGYQGYGPVIEVAIFGLIQAVIFCAFRRLTPIALAHALNNIIAIGEFTWL